MTLKPSGSSVIHLKATQISNGRVVTHSVLTLLSSKPNLHFSAPCIHTLRPSHLTHTLHKCLCGHSLNLTEELIQLKKNVEKKKNHHLFFFHWICSLFGFTTWPCKK